MRGITKMEKDKDTGSYYTLLLSPGMRENGKTTYNMEMVLRNG